MILADQPYVLGRGVAALRAKDANPPETTLMYYRL